MTRSGAEPERLPQSIAPHLAEDFLLDLLTCPAEMLSNILQNRGESSDPKRVVARDGDVVLPCLLGGEPEVTTRLACQSIPE